MKNNKKAIKLVDDAIMTEESAIPIYGRHLETAIFWSGIDKNKQELIKKYMDILIKDTKRHVVMFSEIKQLIDGEKNV